ncbi:hypothetical protein Tco_0110376 [Tanacetum coccineum]
MGPRFAEIPGLPLMQLYGGWYLIYNKFILCAVVECSLLPTINWAAVLEAIVRTELHALEVVFGKFELLLRGLSLGSLSVGILGRSPPPTLDCWLAVVATVLLVVGIVSGIVPCPRFCVIVVRGVFCGQLTRYAALAPTVLGVRTLEGLLLRGAPLSKTAGEIAYCPQPIVNADAPVIVFMSVQVLQLVEILLSPDHKLKSGCRLGLISFLFPLVLRLRPESRSSEIEITRRSSVATFQCEDGPVAREIRSMWRIVLSRGLLRGPVLEAWCSAS